MNKIYIASSPFSGSTLLDLLIGTHPSVCSLGETHNLVLDKVDDPSVWTCSCGKNVQGCDIWSEYYKNVKKGGIKKRHNYLCKVVKENAPATDFVCDSSNKLRCKSFFRSKNKWDRPLSWFDEAMNTDKNSVVIHLIKDVRSYLASLRKRNEMGVYKVQKMMHKWWCANKEMENEIDSREVSHIKVQYENLCMYTQKVLEKIFNIIGVKMVNDIDMFKSTTHVLGGNTMRKSIEKKKKVVYDTTWFNDSLVQQIYLLMPHVKRYNRSIYNEIGLNIHNR